MSKLDTQNINVYNYNQNEVYVDSAKEHYKFGASRDGKTPTVVPISLSELQNICSNTDIILTGWLTFDDAVKEEVFKELRIVNWKNILSNSDIEKILTEPTLEGLQRIIEIENQSYFDRVRMIMFRLQKEGYDVTTRVSRLVEQRNEELRRRQRVSSITLNKKEVTNYATPDQVKELSEQNASLQSQLDEMKKMMEQMMAMQQNNIVTNNKENGATNNGVNAPKKAGRPPKNK